jgi:hypothetical protein
MLRVPGCCCPNHGLNVPDLRSRVKFTCSSVSSKRYGPDTQTVLETLLSVYLYFLNG